MNKLISQDKKNQRYTERGYSKTLPIEQQKSQELGTKGMSSRSLEYIQEVGDDEGIVDCNSACKKVSNCITRNKIIGEIDFFSLDVKFLIEGNQSFRTIFSGLCGIAVLAILGFITYLVAWPSSFSSKIIKTEYNVATNATGLSLFGYSNEPISFSIKPISATPIPPEFAIKLYYVESGKQPLELQWETNCQYGNYCITPTISQGKILQIYGDKAGLIDSGKLTVQMYWCSFMDFNCPPTVMYEYKFYFQNTQKRRSKVLVPEQAWSTIPHGVGMLGLGSYSIFDFPVSRESFTSNNKILGHIANILPQTFYSYNIGQSPKSTSTGFLPSTYSQLAAPHQLIAVVNFAYSNKRYDINEVFVNIITPVLFLFSLLDPLKWIVNQILLRGYNKNCRDLFIASKLYYVQDVENDEKYNFSKGPLVFFMCLIHRHPLTNLLIKVLALCGKNLTDIMPTKCVHIMNMINKGSSLMCENVFFGGLEELSTLEDCPGKKIPFDNIDLDDDQQDKVEVMEQHYFPQNPIRRTAFAKFCKDNEYYSAERKNKVYQTLLDNKFTTFLKDGLHKQFETYVRNIENLKIRGKFLETLEDLHLPVELAGHNDRGDETSSDMKFSKMRGT